MSLPAMLYRHENLQRAWRWIRSNADAGYKTYFREHYSVYAIAQESLLRDLGERLRRGTYHPSSACKIHLPKASGILRPYTLLEIEDQIVYQAAANIVAEQIFPKVKHRYYSQVFGHLYAGKSSTWFYRKWSKGYTAFNTASIDAFDAGKKYTASFDLAAFYDSIDHRVLAHFLEKYRVDRGIVTALCEWLSIWTKTEAQILQGHGIPQGPLSSGLIAETMLSHFDEHQWQKAGVVYLRYVDDIRLFASTEQQLRASLIRLDHLSKDVGLFPQSSKISIHRVTDIRSEIKSVSQPVEITLRSKYIDQGKIVPRLIELSPRYRVEDKTRFKYVLSRAAPNAKLTKRLWRILDNAPDLYDSVARYLARAAKLPRSASLEVVRRIEKEKLYPAISAAFIRAIDGSIHTSVRRQARSSLKKMWAPRTRSPDLTVALAHWLVGEGALNDRQLKYACGSARSSWTRSSLLLAIDAKSKNAELKKALAIPALTDSSADPAIAAASICGRSGDLPAVPIRRIRRQAALILKDFGLIRRAGGRVCGINMSFSALLEKDVSFNWRNLFGKSYRHAERQIVSCRGYASTDATAWVLGLDVFDDLLLHALHKADSTIGGYTLGKIGGCTQSAPKALKAKYPRVLALAKDVHEQRLLGDLAHAKVRGTQKATGRVSFKYISKTKKLIKAAADELHAHGLI